MIATLSYTRHKLSDWLQPAFINSILQTIRRQGYMVLNQFPEQDKPQLEWFCKQLGTPMPHNQLGDIVWDVKARPVPPGHYATFSEHNDEAGLHTDSQYRENPEHFFGLLCLKKAGCGGGESLVLRLSDILTDLQESADGRAAIITLQQEKVPFIIPTAFRSDDGPDHLMAPILTRNGIRFRSDTIEKGFELYKSKVSSKVIDAYYKLKMIIRDSHFIKTFQLEDGDLLLVDNQTMLHGRTAFRDLSRYLLRIRMNYKSATTIMPGIGLQLM